MGLFRSKEEKAADSAALQAEFERVDAMRLPDLAAEVMSRGFGPGGLGENIDIEIAISALYDLYAPIKGFGVDYSPRFKIEDLLKEAASALERAGLLTVREGGEGGSLQYRKTQAGQDALDAGDVPKRVATPGE